MASLKQANTLAPSNVSASGFALGDVRHLGGHRVVASLTALYALFDWQLLNPEETDTALALGQEWYVKGVGKYRLTNWANRKGASGWTKVVDVNNMDTTLFQVVTALPTSGINKNKIYMVLADDDTEEQNVYLEFVYTGDTGAAYDASKWEKLGEYKPEVDTSLYDNVVNRVNSGEFSNVANFDGISTVLKKPTIQTMSVTGDYKVMYLSVTKTFVAVSAGKYYSNWGGAEAFGDFTSDGRTPKKGKIYISGSKAYAWDEAEVELKQIAGSDIASSTADGLMSKADKIALDTLTNSAVTVGYRGGANELALQKDSDGHGYVTISVMSNDDVDALFV